MLTNELSRELRAVGVPWVGIKALDFMADSETGKDDLRAQVLSGQITAENLRGYGDVSHAKLCNFLGLPEPEPNPQARWYVDSPLCPSCGVELNAKK